MATVTGTSGNDVLYGTGGADSIFGLDGNDRMIGGAGADAYDGGNGFDWASYETAGSALVIDLFDGSRSTGEAIGDTYTAVESYVGTAYNDLFWAGNTVTTFDGGPGGDDTVNYSLSTSAITFTFNLTTSTQQGSGSGGLAQGDIIWNIDAMVGTAYNDTYIVNGTASSVTITETAGGGTDTVQTSNSSYTLGAYLENLTYTGTGTFTGTGNSLNNVLTGSTGNDRLIGGGGADTLVGGSGFDWASYETSSSGIVIDLDNGSRSTGDAIGDTYSGIESYVGSTYNDTFYAGATATTMDGWNGTDTVNYSLSTAGITLTFNLTTVTPAGSGTGGYAQGDTLSSIDVIVGSNYDDTYVINGTASSVTLTETSGGGTDTVQTSNANYTLGAYLENLTYSGTSAFTGTGNGLNNVLIGNSGNDRLIGGGGADTLVGGSGADTASYETSSVGVVVDIYDGSRSTGDAVGDSYNSVEIYVGSTYIDTFIANAAATTFDGWNGTDTVDYSLSTSGITLTFNLTAVTPAGSGVGGYAQGDTLVSIDAVVGTSYDDIYVVNGTTSSVTITEAAGGGTDTVQTNNSSYTPGAYIENLTYTGSGSFTGNGNSLNNLIIGNSGNDTLYGNDGDDTLVGGAGADQLVGGNGTDTASYQNAAAAISLNFKTGPHTGDASGDTFTTIEIFKGSNFNDTFVSGASAHNFDGNGGSDTVDYSTSTAVSVNLTTGTGAGGDAAGDTYTSIEKVIGSAYTDTLSSATSGDTLAGGTGNDIYVVRASGITVTEASGEGTDEIQTSLASFSIASIANVENLSYTGSGNFVGTGSTGNNVITGGGGNDTLIGGDGADQLIGGSGTDAADYSASGSAVTIDLTAGTSSGGDAAGDSFSSIEKVIGSSYADSLSSATSGHTLTGGAGNDTYVIGSSGVTVVEASSEGTDEVQTALSSLSIASFANVENLTYTGFSNFAGTGNAGNNSLTGGNGHDTLIGGSGADQLNGGLGTDVASYENASSGVTLNFKTGTHTGDAAGDSFTSIEAFKGSNFADTFVSDASAGTFNGNGGTDTVDYSTSAAAITVNLTTGTGSGGDAAGDSYTSIEKVIGSAYADSLSSSTSGHILAGGAGDDIYTVGSSGVTITEASGEGTDEVLTGLGTFSIASLANVENLTYTGSSNFTGTGNSGNNIIIGGSGNDILIGGGGADQLVGGFGADIASYQTAGSGITLNLKTGTHGGDAAGDTFADIYSYRGSNFVDTFVSGAAADSFDGNGGSDVVDYSTSAAAVTVDLTAGTGSGGDAAGDSFSSIEKVVGSAYADTLSSATSGHILAGGTGDDLYVVGSSGITITEASGEGSDEVQTGLSSFSITGFANVENLTYTGSSNFIGTGNTGDNIITGGIGDDTLVGRAGSDQLIGGFGTDAADYSASASAVTVDLTTGTSSGGEAAGDSFSSIEKVIGSSFADNLSSSISGHILAGGDGNDAIAIGDGTALGDGGNDTISSDGTAAVLYGGAGDDTFSVVGSASIFGGEDSDAYDLSSASLDTVSLRDDGSSGFDKVFLPFLDSASFTQTQVGNDLLLADGTYNVYLKDWFAGFNSIEEFETLDHNTFTI